MRPVLSLHEVSVEYPRWKLQPISAALPPGCTALVGTNGAGKTSLMHAIVGLRSPSTGHVDIGGLRSDRAADRKPLRTHLGFLPQNPSFPRFVTASESVHFAADLKGVPRRDRTTAVGRALDRVDLADRARSRAATLSGGQQRRLALAQAMVHEPAMLILDEPTAGLDPVQRREFKSWLQDYCRDHSALVSTHLIEDVDEVATHVIVLDDGDCIFQGSTEELLARFPGSDLSAALWALFESPAR